MAIEVAPAKSYTFTVTAAPRREAQKKTIMRLMRMQTEVQGGLNRLARRRKLYDNRDTTRAGRIWVARVHPTKLVRAEKGETFTLHVTPQIIPDLKSVGDFLEAKPAK